LLIGLEKEIKQKRRPKHEWQTRKRQQQWRTQKEKRKKHKGLNIHK